MFQHNAVAIFCALGGDELFEPLHLLLAKCARCRIEGDKEISPRTMFHLKPIDRGAYQLNKVLPAREKEVVVAQDRKYWRVVGLTLRIVLDTLQVAGQDIASVDAVAQHNAKRCFGIVSHKCSKLAQVVVGIVNMCIGTNIYLIRLLRLNVCNWLTLSEFHTLLKASVHHIAGGHKHTLDIQHVATCAEDCCQSHARKPSYHL